MPIIILHISKRCQSETNIFLSYLSRWIPLDVIFFTGAYSYCISSWLFCSEFPLKARVKIQKIQREEAGSIASHLNNIYLMVKEL